MATWRTCGKQVTKFFPCLGETLLFWFNSKKKNLKPLLKLFEWMRIAQRIDSICVVLRPIPPLLFIANRMFWLPRTQSRLHEKQPWSMALDYVCLLGWTLLRNFVFSNLMKASKLFFRSPFTQCIRCETQLDTREHMFSWALSLSLSFSLCASLVWLISKQFLRLLHNITFIHFQWDFVYVETGKK